MPDFSLTTARCRLRPWRAEERDRFLEILSDPETMRFWPQVPSIDHLNDRFDAELLIPKNAPIRRWAVELLEDDTIIGDAGLVPDHSTGAETLDLGYIFHADHHGQGYATEVAAALLEYGVKVLNRDDIVCHMATDHDRSRLVAERIGMVQTGTFVSERDAGKEHLIFRPQKHSLI